MLYSSCEGKKQLVLRVEAPSGHVSSLPVCSSTTRGKEAPGTAAYRLQSSSSSHFKSLLSACSAKLEAELCLERSGGGEERQMERLKGGGMERDE